MREMQVKLKYIKIEGRHFNNFTYFNKYFIILIQTHVKYEGLLTLLMKSKIHERENITRASILLDTIFIPKKTYIKK